ncbi:MAG: peptidase D-alanyl-D-alanine carboxypeptidase 1 [Frankiales bacterium]|nr:peptidase D-alanyl-D-alanine carboxypeptidase 1 [Frankiales bacterium]
MPASRLLVPPVLTALLALTGCAAPPSVLAVPHAAGPVWPAEGQASYALHGRVSSSPRQRPVPIASVAKLMTAYLVVHRLAPSRTVVVRRADVVDTARRRTQGESVVEVREGEVLTRDQALAALLLPSANNVAALLAGRVAGSRSAFVRLMQGTADELGMTSTTYTDPSGYLPSTVSTARDQLLLLRAVLRSPVLARLLGARSAVLPVVGRVASTDTLLGRDGFVAGKTGSTSAAGGCLAFRVVRGREVLDGVVLGQHGGRLVDAGLAAAQDLADQVLGPA